VGDLVARHGKTYTLSLFTHSELRHLESQSRTVVRSCAEAVSKIAGRIGAFNTGGANPAKLEGDD
jgi:hypothetical protein